MNRTMEALGSWMSSNWLRLNPHKMQFIWLGTRQQLAQAGHGCCQICLSSFCFLFSGLRPWLHPGSGAHPCSPHSLTLSCLLLPAPSALHCCPVFVTTTATLVHFFVTSRLVYCSSLYIGLSAVSLSYLDHSLRSAARLIGGLPKLDHISASMCDVLHWLPLRQRIEFRVAVLVWYSLIDQAPTYLIDLSNPPLSTWGTWSLHSTDQDHITFACTSARQNRAFSLADPLVWNSLPLALRPFPRIFSQAT